MNGSFTIPRGLFGVMLCFASSAALAQLSCTRDSDCSNGIFCDGTERCAPGAVGSDARGCRVATAPMCTTTQTCDESTDRCRVRCDGSRDSDGDGIESLACGGTDCDDNNPGRYPGNTEVCGPDATLDEDCDPGTWGRKPGPANDHDFIDCQPGRGAQQPLSQAPSHMPSGAGMGMKMAPPKPLLIPGSKTLPRKSWP